MLRSLFSGVLIGACLVPAPEAFGGFLRRASETVNKVQNVQNHDAVKAAKMAQEVQEYQKLSQEDRSSAFWGYVTTHKEQFSDLAINAAASPEAREEQFEHLVKNNPRAQVAMKEVAQKWAALSPEERKALMKQGGNPVAAAASSGKAASYQGAVREAMVEKALNSSGKEMKAILKELTPEERKLWLERRRERR